MSGGEKQRVALAQALLGKPRLLILDEPLASLDPRNQKRMVECIAKIKATTGATIFFIAHDVNPLLGVMDRVIYVAGGRASIGSTDEIISSAVLSKLYGTEINVVRAEEKSSSSLPRATSSRPRTMIEQIHYYLSYDFVRNALSRFAGR